MTWRLSSLTREAKRNVIANGVRSLALVIIIASGFAVLAFLEIDQAHDIDEFQREFEEAGGYLVVVYGPPGSIDAGRCDVLQRLPGVQSAGAVSVRGTVSFRSAPGILFQSAFVTAGALRAWRPGASIPVHGGYVVGRGLAEELGLRQGSYTALVNESPALVESVLAADRRSPRSVRWLLEVAAPSFHADECWVELSRDSYEFGVAALPAWFAQGSSEPTVRPYLDRNEFTRDVASEFASRPQQHGWLALGGLIAGVLVLAAWLRRAELGLYLALGTSRTQHTVLLGVEATLLIGVAFATGFLWALASGRLLGMELPLDHIVLVVRSTASAALAALATAPALSTLVVRGNIQSMLKDR